MKDISLFKNFTTVIGSRTLAEIVNGIKGDHFKKTILEIQNFIKNGKKEKASHLKKGLVAFTVSGLFEGGRKLSFLKSYNPFVILDIDRLDSEILSDLVLKINNIDFTRVAFKSPSDQGLKIIIEVDSGMKMHGHAYQQVSSFYEKELEVAIDKSGKDITRLCFMSHDPAIYFNQESTVFKVLKYDMEVNNSSSKKEEISPKRTTDNSINSKMNYVKAFEICVTQANAKLVFEKGNRNNYIYRLGIICSHAGIPLEVAVKESKKRFDFNDNEIERTIKSAYDWQPYPSEISNGKSSIELPSEVPPVIPAKVFDQLPILLKGGSEVLKDQRERDVFLTGALGVLSGLLPKVSGVYDGHICFPNLFVFVIAPAASGKGALKFSKCLGSAYHDELLEVSKKEKQDYKKALVRFEIESTKYRKGKIETQPESPEERGFKTLFIPANSSSAMLIRHLNQNEDSGILFESEADTLGNVLKQDWGGYSDLLRKAYHHEPISYSRKSNSDFIEIAEPKLSVALSGTPGQVTNLIPSAEDGLFSRFVFYAFEVESIWRDVSPQGRSHNFQNFYQGLSREVLEMVHFLKLHPTEFNLSKAQWKMLNETFKKLMEETNEMFGTEALSIVKRMGLVCFRIAMILSTIRRFEEKSLDPKLICKDDDFQAAIWLSETYFKHGVFVYDRLPRYQTNKFQFKNVKKQLFFDALPERFIRKEVLELCSNFNISKRSGIRYLRELTISGFLVQSPIGKFGEYFKQSDGTVA